MIKTQMQAASFSGAHCLGRANEGKKIEMLLLVIVVPRLDGEGPVQLLQQNQAG